MAMHNGGSMKLIAVAVLVTLCACVGPTVDVTPVGPVPHALSPRAPEAVRHFELRPENGIEVYDIEAYGDAKPKLLAAVRQKAASLGCDGLMFSAPTAASRTDSEAATGQLNEHHQKPGSHVEAVCIVLQAGAAETGQ
jgi:uroporphyrinogen-III synthase